MLVLFPPHIRNKYREDASYVNTVKNNAIHFSIQTQRIKLKEGSVSRGTNICQGEVQNKERRFARHCCLKLTTATFKNDTSIIYAVILH